MAPQVSVILTVYKRTDFLSEALRSALEQTFHEREIIVTDDSGTRAAFAICEPFVAAGHIRYRANPKPLDIAGNVAAAMHEATGEFVAILNDDDVWEPNFLAELVPVLQADRNRVLAFCDHWVVLENGRIDHAATEANSIRWGRAALPGGEVANPTEFAFSEGVPLAMAAVFRKDAIPLEFLTPEISSAYDLWISTMLAASGGKFFYVPKRLTRYRVHARAETGRRDPNKSKQTVALFTQLLKRDCFSELRSNLKARLAGALFRLGRDRLYFDCAREARAAFFQSLQTRINWRAGAGVLISLLPRSLRMRLHLTAASTSSLS